jgi:hypothetical protein
MAGRLGAWLVAVGTRVGGGDRRLLQAGAGLHVLGADERVDYPDVRETGGDSADFYG